MLGCEMAKKGHTLVFGGGAAGMMGAAARGVKSIDGKMIGICPSFLNVDGALRCDCDELILTSDMATRKNALEDKSDAFVITAGGIGTFDEFFQCLVLKQLGQHKKPIAILNTDGYYDELLNMLKTTVNQGFMFETSMSLFGVFKTPKEVIEYCENCHDELVDITKMKSVTR